MIDGLRAYKQFAWLLLLIPIYLFIFLKLGNPHIRLWDEGWFSVHAIEMWKHNSWIVSWYDGEPSSSASKPPLHTWLQILSLKLFGISELSVRLPSALAAAATVLALYFWVNKHRGTGLAFGAAMVLLTSVGFIGFHTARGAEADALITLVLFLQAVVTYAFIHTQNTRWLVLLGLIVGVGFWVKSVATLLFLPGFALYFLLLNVTLIQKALTSWHLYAGLALALSMAGAYLYIRYKLQPSYLDVFVNSNISRYTSSVGHDHPWDYYLRNFMDGRYFWWLPFFVGGLVIIFTDKTVSSSIVGFASVSAVVYLLVISLSKSKLQWYDMPFYPMAAIPASYFTQVVIRSLSRKTTAGVVLVLAIFLLPSWNMFLHSQASRLTLQEMEFEAQEIFLKNAYDRGKNLDGVVVLTDHFDGAVIFYIHKFDQIGQHIRHQSHTINLEPGDRVLVKAPDQVEQLRQKFTLIEMDRYRGAVLYELAEPRAKLNQKQNADNERITEN
ncbi:MAG: hypothetical protein Kow0075_08580 [Salibacteraceae bacterium]